jgi:hypothetical protein
MSDDAPVSESTSEDGGDSAFETWLVRFFLVLVFGVAFGIEGRTLIRTYLESDDDDPAAEAVETASEERAVGVGDALLPGVPARVRTARLTAATQGDWTFRLTVAPGSLSTDTLTLAVNRLTTTAGASLSGGAARHSWTPGDTTALATTWSLPPGQQPATLHVTARHATPDTVRTLSRSVPLARVPVRGIAH